MRGVRALLVLLVFVYLADFKKSNYRNGRARFNSKLGEALQRAGDGPASACQKTPPRDASPHGPHASADQTAARHLSPDSWRPSASTGGCTAVPSGRRCPAPKGRRGTSPAPASPPPPSRRMLDTQTLFKLLQSALVEVWKPAVHGKGSNRAPPYPDGRAPPPPHVSQQLFLRATNTAPYQTLHGGQFKPSSVANRAKMEELHGQLSRWSSLAVPFFQIERAKPATTPRPLPNRAANGERRSANGEPRSNRTIFLTDSSRNAFAIEYHFKRTS